MIAGTRAGAGVMLEICTVDVAVSLIFEADFIGVCGFSSLHIDSHKLARATYARKKRRKTFSNDLEIFEAHQYQSPPVI